MPDHLEQPEQQIENDIHAQENGTRTNAPSVLTCPECGGVLWEFRSGDLLEYRCHVGHVYSSDSLQSQQDETLEMALWSAVRALAEKAILTRRLAERSREAGRDRSAARFEKQADEAAEAVALLRRMLVNGRGGESEDEVDY